MPKVRQLGRSPDAGRTYVGWYNDETARSEQQGCDQDRPVRPLLLGSLMDFQDRILSVERHSPGLGWAYSRGFLYQRLSTVQVADPGEEGTDAFTGVPRSPTSKEGDTARERALQTSSWQGQIWKKTGRRCSGDPDWGFGAIPSGRDEARDRDLHSSGGDGQKRGEMLSGPED